MTMELPAARLVDAVRAGHHYIQLTLASALVEQVQPTSEEGEEEEDEDEEDGDQTPGSL